jgi:RNA polymerase sigma-70 factor, ECF subfamily
MISRISNPMRALTLKAPSGSNELLVRLRRGDPAAVGEVYDQHHRAVRAFAQRLLNDDAAAEDLVHEVFVELPRLIKNFRADSSLRSFLTGVAINHARHHVRAAQRRRAAQERLAEHHRSTPPAAPPSPERSALNRHLVQALARALDDLPLEQRVAFVLCDVEERTSREAAALAGAPEVTMRTRLHHARKKLRGALKKEGIS